MTSYYREPCSGCGRKIEVEQPARHVVSAHTGAYYCPRCTTQGLPPVRKRPLSRAEKTALDHLARGNHKEVDTGTLKLLVKRDLVDADSRQLTEKGNVTLNALVEEQKEKRTMSAAKTEKTPRTTEVHDKLIDQIKSTFPNVQLLTSGKDRKSEYVTVKTDYGKTICYVSGKYKPRIDGIVKDGTKPKFVVASLDDVSAGIAFVKENLAVVEARKTSSDAKTSAKPASKAKAKTSSKAKSDVKPDPKPASKRRSSKSTAAAETPAESVSEPAAEPVSA